MRLGGCGMYIEQERRMGIINHTWSKFPHNTNLGSLHSSMRPGR